MKEIKNNLITSTIEEIRENLRLYRKCIVLRPTGFGKTYIAVNEAIHYNHVVFLYPRKIIKQTIETKYTDIISLCKISFLSYQKLTTNIDEIVNIYELEGIHDGVDTLFIFDEAHMIGAEKTSKAISQLQELFPNSNYLGLTATPERADWYDYKSLFFDNRTISPYTLTDCIKDGLFNKPYYIYTLFSTRNCLVKLKEKTLGMTNSEMRETISNKLRDIEVKTSAFLNMDEVLFNSISDAISDYSYLKFMVFFSKIETLHEKIEVIKTAFSNAFPNHQIRTLIVTSELEYRNNIDDINCLTNQPNTIDLIASVDMLSLGYHVDDLTGVIMLRATESDIIYKQQIGRCLSIATDNTAIIFDFVGNMFRKQYHTGFGSNAVINRNDADDMLGADIMNLALNDVTLFDYVTELEDVDRIIEMSSDEVMSAVVNAYIYKNAPISFCTKRLGVSTEEFLHLVSVYKNWRT